MAARTPSRPKPIEPATTDTAGFVGLALKGPIGKATFIASFADFERIYGGLDPLRLKEPDRSKLSAAKKINYLAHSVEAFFKNGGSRLFVSRVLEGDGCEPTASSFAAALSALDRVEAVAIVAAPGSSIFNDGDAIAQELVRHVQRPRAYRVAVLEWPPAVTGRNAKEVRTKIDSSYAAFYGPWIYVPQPDARAQNTKAAQTVLVPPSGFVCGIYARNDHQRGVSKAPVNEAVLGAVGLERTIKPAEQRTLDASGINSLRIFPRQGLRVWGARAATSDPEWKYINIRRYAAYLEHSIDRGTQFAVFEDNGPGLWNAVQATITDFLFNEWKNGGLLGRKPEQAYFVRCDRTTMTENDLDNGRLICLIGVAVVKPAEFVIIRIQQMTAERKPS